MAVVGVARHEVHQMPVEQRLAKFPRPAAELAQQALRGHLHEGAGFHPTRQILQTVPQQLIALGMGHDRRHARLLEARKNVRRVAENHHVGELHQQIALLIDGVFPRIGDGVLDVVVAQMEIAAGIEAQPVAHRGRDLGQPLANPLRLETVAQVGVRRPDQVRSAAVCRHARHGDGFLQRRRAIIHAIQQVAVNVDQASILAQGTRTGTRIHKDRPHRRPPGCPVR